MSVVLTRARYFKTMKKLTLFLLMLLCSYGFTQAQDKQLYEAIHQALAKGREPFKPYICPIDFKFKAKDYEKVTEKVNVKVESELGNLLFDGNTTDGTYVDTVAFFPVNEYHQLAFEAINPWNEPGSSLKTQGKIMVPNLRLNIEDALQNVSQNGQNYQGNFLTTVDDAYWSGSVTDGWIDGEGFALIMDLSDLQEKDRIRLSAVKGTFDKGFPMGELQMVKVTFDGLVLFRHNRVFPYKDNLEVSQFQFQDLPGGDAIMTAKEYTAQINRNGKGHFTTEVINEYNWKLLHQLAYRDKNWDRGVYDFTGENIHQQTIQWLMDNNGRITSNPDVIAQWCVERLRADVKHAETPWNMFTQVISVLKAYPDVKGVDYVSLDAQGVEKVKFRDFILGYAKDMSRVLEYYDVFKDYGNMTKDEIARLETVSILWGGPNFVKEKYKIYFPGGKYQKSDPNEAWALEYINNAKAILRDNQDYIWEGYSNGDWHKHGQDKTMPTLSKNVAPYVARNDWGFAVTRYVFDKSGYSGNDDEIFSALEKSNVQHLDEAKKYRKLMDCIAMGNQINPTILNLIYKDEGYFTGIDKSDFFKQMEDGIYIARELEQSDPEIRDGCKAAADFLARKMDAVDNVYQSRLEYWKGVRSARVKNIRKANCEKCKVNGKETTFPSGWEDEWSLIFVGAPAQSKESGKIVLQIGWEIGWKYVESGGKIKVKTDGLLGGEIYDSVNDMIEAILDKCRKEHCN